MSPGRLRVRFLVSVRAQKFIEFPKNLNSKQKNIYFCNLVNYICPWSWSETAQPHVPSFNCLSKLKWLNDTAVKNTPLVVFQFFYNFIKTFIERHAHMHACVFNCCWLKVVYNIFQLYTMHLE